MEKEVYWDQAFMAMSEEGVQIVRGIDSRDFSNLKLRPEKMEKKVTINNHWEEIPLPTEGLDDKRFIKTSELLLCSRGHGHYAHQSGQKKF